MGTSGLFNEGAYIQSLIIHFQVKKIIKLLEDNIYVLIWIDIWGYLGGYI